MTLGAFMCPTELNHNQQLANSNTLNFAELKHEMFCRSWGVIS